MSEYDYWPETETRLSQLAREAGISYTTAWNTILDEIYRRRTMPRSAWTTDEPVVSLDDDDR